MHVGVLLGCRVGPWSSDYGPTGVWGPRDASAKHLQPFRPHVKIEGMETLAMTGTTFRRHLTEALNRVHDGDHIEVTHYNRTTGVLVPADWYREALRLMSATETHE